MNERLYRSRDERMLAGVCGGLAERFDLDPSLVRVLWVVLVFATGGLFLLLYIAMAVVVPEAPSGRDQWAAWDGPVAADAPGGPTAPPPAAAATPPAGSPLWPGPAGPRYRPRGNRGSGGGAVIAGIVLVLVGGYLLLRTVVPQVDLGGFWPLVLVGVGIALLVGSIRPGSGGRPAD